MTSIFRRPIVVMVLAVSTVTGLEAGTQGPSADEIVARAEAYVAGFVTRFSSVVAEERYLQNSVDPLLGDLVRRRLVSDFLLVQLPGDARWRAFRDIREVDGNRVADREARLTKLFLLVGATVSDQVAQINRDWTRYSLGDQARTVNNPLLALSFLQRVYHERFRFSIREVDKTLGPEICIVEYKEAARPTILRAVPDGDLPADGRFWIERGTGRVMKSELRVGDSDTVTTSFRFDTRLQTDIPFEMRENYRYRGRRVTTTATYVNFRRFEVHTDVRPK